MIHQYLRAVGFRSYSTAQEAESLVKMTLHAPTWSRIIRDRQSVIGHLCRSFGDGFGISTVGEFTKQDVFVPQYHIPYAESPVLSTKEYCTVEPYSDRIAFGGMCEDMTLGVSLIFFITNTGEYLRRQSTPGVSTRVSGIYLSALSLEGKILLPSSGPAQERRAARASVTNRNLLMEAAANGDREAMESLAREEMSLSAKVSGRAEHEDLYSIVDTCFMPFGLESDKYSIIGRIEDVVSLQNSLTEEELFRLVVNCNDLRFTVLINKADLLGEPAVGRRFKGDIWMQGRLRFGEG